MDTIPSHFYDEPIEVIFDQPPLLEKKPDCPQGFIWRGETYHITEILEEWVDYRRRGKMARNMKPAHLSSASRKGSWGVGRFCFRVKVESGRFFELYYDRAPENVDNRKGNWFLLGERISFSDKQK
ncbi:MAG: Uncharacterized protein FD147_284 [Chloroflexi bacterium]|nr:MAG: Uncharacterized protein FD147_284 [Chloroflexota bacterium]MBA4375262.1 hypothetical protein [Anaerolinea sp.]